MEKKNTFNQGYQKWRNDGENDKDIISLENALWTVLKQPNLLSSDKKLQYQIFTLIRMFLGKRPVQFKLLKDLCLKASLDEGEMYYCLMGKIIEKMLPQVDKLKKKEKELGKEEDFGKYLYKTAENITKHCVEEFINELMEDKINHILREEYYGNYNNKQFIDLPYIQYDIVNRYKAKLLVIIINEEWDKREINVLCHELEEPSKGGTKRLRDESRDNIYKLHERIRKKFKQTLENNNFDDNVGRLFIYNFLKKICQSCPPYPTYKKEKGE
ncbi:hypothetical protein [Candidatus Cloacimonas acidaminovorans]|jgi:hypothetical protein|nr:hypothetical protein [Candidatus Cloacimonas acidaminovorans]HNV62802.1 hypothetical protein [Candidatus Cloacimonas acidaminovorans]